jgi:hypothetical protein
MNKQTSKQKDCIGTKSSVEPKNMKIGMADYEFPQDE